MEKNHDPRYKGWLKAEMRNYGAETVQCGAGTHRQFGRMAFMLNYPNIRRQVETHFMTLLQEAATRDIGNATVQQDAIEVVIVTSSAGGTGAGMFLDVAYLVRDILRTHDRLRQLRGTYTTLITVLPTPFKHVTEETMYRKFQANAYASLLEMEYYSTRYSDDESFVGQVEDERKNVNRVGFVAPWADNKFIEGTGWETCYLVDNSNPLRSQMPLALDETFQMIADYLFLDFKRPEFGVQKRPVRGHHLTYRDNYIRTSVRRPELQATDLSSDRRDTDVVFVAQNGCTFRSFGLAEICFDRDRIYRAAGYRLASQLLEQHWIGRSDRLVREEYKKLTIDEFCRPKPNSQQSEPPVFMPDELTVSLYEERPHGNWLSRALDDCNKIRSEKPLDWATRLGNLHAGHAKLLSDGVQEADEFRGTGRAFSRAHERAHMLAGHSEKWGPLPTRLRDICRQAVDRYGILVATEFLNYYEMCLSDLRLAAVERMKAEDKPANSSARLEEALRMQPPARKLVDRWWPPAQKRARCTEFSLVCNRSRDIVCANYRWVAAERIVWLMDFCRAFVGVDHRGLGSSETLCGYLERSKAQLGKLHSCLSAKFEMSSREEGSDRRQPLTPTAWGAKEYDDLINRSLVSYSRLGADGSGRLQWQAFEKLVFEELGGDAKSLTEILGSWFEKDSVSSYDVPRIAESLASACREILHKAKLDLNSYCDGSVIDLLTTVHDEAHRKLALERLVRTSAPYLPLEMQTQVDMAGSYRPAFENLLSRQRGDRGNASNENEKRLMEELDAISRSIGGDIDNRVHSKLDGDRTALVVCREVWGVPLQYYAELNKLRQAYMTLGPDVGEYHINYHESWEDLPDVRAIDSETYAQIRDNVEHVLSAMITGTITCDKDGLCTVRVPKAEGIGFELRRLGKRISRIIRRACEEDAVRECLQRHRAEWERKAKPKDMAMVYASALKTHLFIRRHSMISTGGLRSSPLGNCSAMLMDQVTRRLRETEEGAAWYDLLRERTEDQSGYDEAMDRNRRIYDVIEERKILFRAFPHVPIYTVDSDQLFHLNLPDQDSDQWPMVPEPQD